MAATLVSGCRMFALRRRAPHSVRVRFSSLRTDASFLQYGVGARTTPRARALVTLHYTQATAMPVITLTPIGITIWP